jgi:hypothetical protein
MKISIVFMLICIAITTTTASALINNWQESAGINGWSNPSSSFTSFNKLNIEGGYLDGNPLIDPENRLRQISDLRQIWSELNPGKTLPARKKKKNSNTQKNIHQKDVRLKSQRTQRKYDNELKKKQNETAFANAHFLPIRPIRPRHIQDREFVNIDKPMYKSGVRPRVQSGQESRYTRPPSKGRAFTKG